MEKQHTKKSSLVFLPVIFMGSLLFALVSCGAVGQIPGGPFQPSQDGTAVTAGGSPTAGSPTKTTGTSGAITRAAAQVDSTVTAQNSGGGIPSQGKVIVVNRATNVQELYAYDNGKLVFTTPVTTGSLYLQTFLGTFQVYQKLRDFTMYSPWPKGSPNYYAPLHVNYGLDYDGDIYIHDAPWRGVFGPGTDRYHNDPKMGWTTGSHGCVEVPTSAGEWLYNWAPIGTIVEVID
ncbi:MAG TPA: L,D-transpeptidase [Ktedonobacteraceae bacterium]|nr:L,D-transpeptidase [Ktedonobacteraceae bacterium]